MPFRDEDFDGYDDETGETAAQVQQRERSGTSSQDRYGYQDRDGDGTADYYVDDRGQDREIRDGESEYQARQRYAAEERDAGQVSRGDPATAGQGPSGRSSDFDESSAGTFLWGDISGANRRAAEADREREQWLRQRYIDEASDYIPSADDLWVQYEQEGEIAGPERSEAAGAYADRGSVEAQQDALSYLQNVYREGGMTDADRARQTLARMQSGQASRASRDADLAALEARGMGGSGAALASRLGAQQGAAQSLAQQDALMMIEAQARGDRAAQSAGGLGSQMRGQSFSEDYQRRSAADDFNRYQTDYQRAREGRNTAYRNRTRESRAESRQQSYENRAGIAQMRTGQVPGTRDPSEVSDESNDRTGGFLGGILSALAGS